MDREVDIYDTSYVRGLFDRVSSTYGYTNYIASFGFTDRWRKQCIAALGQLGANATGCDLMSGRGETWVQLFAQHGIAKLTGLDISPEMIKASREQAGRIDAAKFELLEQDVFENTIASASADFVISTFGVKTFNPRQLRLLASEISRILKPGGRFSLVEVSEPKGWILRPLYMFYLLRVMPVIERVFLGYSYGFSMIGVYVSGFGDCRGLQGYLEEEGLCTQYQRLFFGCASGVSGYKPSADVLGLKDTDAVW